MFWKKQPDDLFDLDRCCEQMHRFLEDMAALRPFIAESPEIAQAYEKAIGGANMACKHYIEALRRHGHLSR